MASGGQPNDPLARWRRSSDLTHRTLAGTTIIRLLSDENQIVLRSLASLVWTGLESPSTVLDLAEDLRSVDVPVTDLELMLELRRLEARGVIVGDD